MPQSTNAPFNEFGQSMILRDIEQLYLALNGAGTGSPGDGQTQDQSEATSQDSGGVPDLSGLATTAYVDAAIDAIPDVSYPISIANGGTGAQTALDALQGLLALLPLAATQTVYTTPGAASFVVPAGVTFVQICLVGGGGGGAWGVTAANTTLLGYVASSSGGATTSIVNVSNMATGGGGGGGAAIVGLLEVVPGETLTLNVGAGGSAASGSDSSGSSGTSSTLAASGMTTISAGPGGGGVCSVGSSPGSADLRGGNGGETINPQFLVGRGRRFLLQAAANGESGQTGGITVYFSALSANSYTAKGGFSGLRLTARYGSGGDGRRVSPDNGQSGVIIISHA